MQESYNFHKNSTKLGFFNVNSLFVITYEFWMAQLCLANRFKLTGLTYKTSSLNLSIWYIIFRDVQDLCIFFFQNNTRIFFCAEIIRSKKKKNATLKEL